MSADRIDFGGQTSGCIRVFGVLTLLVNAGMALAGGLLLAHRNLAGIALAVLGGLGVAFGLVLALMRYEGYLDCHAGLVVQSWRVGFELKRRETPVAGAAVVVGTQQGRTRSHAYLLHVVGLKRGGDELVRLKSFGTEPEAQAFAREVTAFLGHR